MCKCENYFMHMRSVQFGFETLGSSTQAHFRKQEFKEDS